MFSERWGVNGRVVFLFCFFYILSISSSSSSSSFQSSHTEPMRVEAERTPKLVQTFKSVYKNTHFYTITFKDN